MKPIEVEIRLRNNRLLKARQRHKLTQKELADAIGVTVQRIGNIELLKEPPIDKKTGYWSELALDLSDYFCEQPEFLFPAETYNLDGRPTVQRVELEAEDIPNVLLEQSLSQLPNPEETAIKKEITEQVAETIHNSPLLSQRQKHVIEMLYGINGQKIHTQQEVAAHFNVSKARIYQIEGNALRMLRHPLHTSKLRQLTDF